MLELKHGKVPSFPIQWELNWKMYPSKFDTKTGATTFVLRFTSFESATRFYRAAKRFLARRFTVKTEAGEVEVGSSRSIVKVYESATLIAYMTHFALHEHVQITTYQSAYASLVQDRIMALVYDDVFVAQVEHGKQTETLGDGLSVDVVTGACTCNGETTFGDLASLYTLRLGSQCMGKAFIHYYNNDMADCAPTIELFEIAGAFQSKRMQYSFRMQGFGLRLLKAMRTTLKKQGFDRVWATYIMDTNAVNFWKKAGFHAQDQIGEMVLRGL